MINIIQYPFLLLIAFIIVACDSKSETPPTVVMSKATNSPVLPIKESPELPTYEKISKGEFMCLNVDFDTIKPALKYPVDLVVTEDGSKIYILNKRCDDSFSSYPDLAFDPYFNPECNTTSGDVKIAERNYIHELNTKTGELSILKFKGTPPLSCEISEELEIDAEGNLYANALRSHQLYKINMKKETVENFSDARVRQSNLPLDIPFSELVSRKIPYLHGPAHLYFDKRQMLFSLDSFVTNLESGLYRININGKTETLSYGSTRNKYLSAQLYKGEVYFGGFGKQRQDKPLAGIGFEAESFDLTLSPDISTLNSIHSRFDKQGSIFTVEENHYIYKYTFETPSKSRLDIYSGNGKPGYKDGTLKDAQFAFPMGLAFDNTNNMYIADTGNHAIRKITPEGVVSTIYKENY